MEKNIYISPQNNVDLEICQCGAEKCNSGHFYGPAIRSHYLIHYIISGKGIFRKGDTTYYLNKNQGFLITPFELTYYEADIDEPWEYIWVGFIGRKADIILKNAGLNIESPIFTNTMARENMLQMINFDENIMLPELHILGELYKMFAYLSHKDSVDSEVSPVYKAIEFIRNNVGNEISIEQIANDLGYNRCYFSKIFKKTHGVSLMQYLMNYRMELACQLLCNRELKISDVARSVGYSDPLFFSRQFKKVLGVSPENYRRTQI